MQELTLGVCEHFLPFLVHLVVYSESMSTMNRCMRALTRIALLYPKNVMTALEGQQG